MNTHSRRSDRSRRTSEPASESIPRSSAQAIELFAQNRYDYEIPLDAFAAIKHHFPRHLVRPMGDLPWREELNYPIRCREYTVEIQTRDGYRLRKWLVDAGYAARLTLFPPAPHLAVVDAKRLNSLIDPMWHLPELLAVDFAGQFEVESPRDVPQLVRALASAFPHAPCVIPFASFAEAKLFRDDLQRIVDEPVTLMRGFNQRLSSRLVVSTYQALLEGVHQQTPLVIVPRWPGTFHQRLKLLGRQPGMQRLYLIRTEQDLICPNDVAELLHRIGPILCAFGRHRLRAQHILHTVPFGGRHRPEKIPSGIQIDKKRGIYWRHQRRNQLLANLARQLASDEKSLKTLPAHRQHVAVLVDLTEHAHKLAGLLRGWPIVTQDDVTAPIPHRCIITLLAAAACPNLAPYYLINAGGGPASPWLESWLEERALARTAIRLVDLSDGFSGETAALSHGRQAGYKRAGAVWRPLAKQFLKPVLDALRDSIH